MLSQAQFQDLSQRFLATVSQLEQNLGQNQFFQIHGTRDESSSFHQVTRYPELLHGRVLEDLEGLFTLDMPNATMGERFIFDSLVYLLQKGESRIYEISRHARQILNSFFKDQVSLKPFKPLQQQQSLHKYIKVFSAFIIFMLRTYQGSRTAAEEPDYPTSWLDLYLLKSGGVAVLDQLMNSIYQATLSQPASQSTSQPISQPTSQSTPGWVDNLIEGSDDELEPEEISSDDDAPSNHLSGSISGLFSDSQLERSSILIQEFFLDTIQQMGKFTKNSPIYAFLACYSRDYQRGCFKPVGVITQIYSAFIYCSQLMIVDYIYQQFDHDQEEPDMDFAAYLHDFMKKWVTNQSDTPLGEVLACRIYGFKVNEMTNGLGQEVLQVNPHQLRFKHLLLSQGQLQEFLQKSLINLAYQLANHLFLDFEIFQYLQPMISLQQASGFEEFTNSSFQFYFLTNNPEADVFKNHLRDKILYVFQDDWFELDRTENCLKLKPKKIESYLGQVNTFLVTLLTLSHLTSGAPARGTEINQILFKNTRSRQRNLFLDPRHSLFLIKLSYSKTFSQTNLERNAIRVLPSSLSWLLLAYLLVVEPFIRFLTISQFKKTTRGSELLFFHPLAHKAIESRQLSSQLRTMTIQKLGQSLSLGSWRHLALGFIRLGMKEVILDHLNLEDDPDEGLAADQMHHSTRTAMMVYGRQIHQMPNLPHDQENAYIQFSQRWHIYLGLGDEQFPLLTLLYPRDQYISLPSHPPPPPSTGSSSLGLATPALLFTRPQIPGIHPPSQKVSLGALHECLSLGYSDENDSLSSSGESLDLDDLDPSQRIRSTAPDLRRSNQVDIHLLDRLLQDFLQDSQATFKSPEQRQALYSYLARPPYLILNLPTAGGKTTIFLLGASLATSKTTIIVAPLVVLKQDLEQKARDLGLSPSIWDDQYQHSASSRILLVSIEHAASPSFFQFTQGLMTQGLVDHLVFDEAHLIPLAAHYRKVMHQVKQIIRLPIPIVFASATLGYHTLDRLKQMMMLDHPLIIRASIDQPSLFYGVRTMPSDLSLDQAYARVMDFIKFFYSKHGGHRANPKVRTMVFCMNVAYVNAIHEAYPERTAYFHGRLDESTKQTELQAFIQGERPILVATGAIGAGYDFSGLNLALIIHLEGAYGLSDFIQESGRASRQPNRPGWSYIFTRESQLHKPCPSGLEKALFHEYLVEKICRRRPIFRVFNEQPLDRCLGYHVKCDLCKSRDKVFRRTTRKAVGFYQQVYQESLHLVNLLEVWSKHHCVECWIGEWGKSLYLGLSLYIYIYILTHYSHPRRMWLP